MTERQWDALAEVFLTSEDSEREIRCLCSRVFIRSRDDKIKLNANLTDECSVSETEVLTEDDNKDHVVQTSYVEQCSSLCQSQESNDHRQEVDPEIVSCYCSASHTDNISTDEHDSLRDSHPNLKFHPIRGLQSSDSGADLTEYSRFDHEAAWHRYWALNGERIIWDSWIAKYSDYINPEFLPQQKKESSKFSFDKKDIEKLGFEPILNGDSYVSNLDRIDENIELKDYKQPPDGTILIRALSGSDSYDKLHTEVSEGWNPLSPISIECDVEAERLLSSRCGSYASSSARTVDSMTNVTRMTVSSFDLSDSSKTSDSFSSVSSVQSSFSSTSSEEVDLCEPNDYKHQWDTLWKKHYEEEYANEYKKFVADHHINNKKYFTSYGRNEKFKDTAHAIDTLFLTLKMSDTEIIVDNEEIEGSFVDENPEELELMKAIGLPICFGANKRKKRSILHTEDKWDVEEQKNLCHIKSAFNLMGLEFAENKKLSFEGRVDYKMKHIRLQNRHLKLHRPKPKHIRFDDDGNIIPNEDKEKEYLSDSSDDQQSTSSDGEEEQSKVQTFQPEELEKPETVSARKKKRKRKINLPPEIRENPNLRKYWSRRFSLFHKFDQGIRLDEESWYSVTPEQIAKHTAHRLRDNALIVDAFCGAGGNAIQFALAGSKVIAVDIDPVKIELARHNSAVYNVSESIDFVIGNFLTLAPQLRADAVFLSPPWGGPAYLRQATYDLETFLRPVSLTKLIEAARHVTENVALYLPRNSDTYPLTLVAGPSGSVEIEQNFINKKFVAITAYYKDLIKRI